MSFFRLIRSLRILPTLLLALFAALTLTRCSIGFSFSGASIDYTKTKTAKVSYFNNMAAMVSPILSSTLTDDLQQRIASQTRLQLLSVQEEDEADVEFEGEITDYRSDPVAISAGEYALKNRLTITVRVRFTNRVDPQYSFDKLFSEYEDYDTSELLTSAEPTLIPQIVEKLVENIFNEAFSNW